MGGFGGAFEALPSPDPNTDPTTSGKFSSGGKANFIKEAPNLRPILGTQLFSTTLHDGLGYGRLISRVVSRRTPPQASCEPKNRPPNSNPDPLLHIPLHDRRDAVGASIVPPPPPSHPSQMGLDRGPTPPGHTTHPLGKVLSAWGSPTTARPSGRNRGCRSWSPGEPDFRRAGGGGLMHAQFGVPWVQVARSPVS